MDRKMKREAEEELEEATPRKKQALDDSSASDDPNFRTGLFSQLEKYRQEYAESKPYKHGVISDLLADSLLRQVRSEIKEHISFTLKETDIYRIEQSGDLANLDGLEEDALQKLPSLKTLRDALYSPDFRDYLSRITQSGPLSGSKTDMAINVYTAGCHLLCHDDVIGTRRVSYILYLTDPDQPWQKDWGGALRLYPTIDHEDADGRTVKVPKASPSISIPPAFNQLSFFAVQPGESFHDVEEVYAPTGLQEKPEHRVRMAISGWYHIPQEGEDGYREGLEAELAETSSLTQLQGASDRFDLPAMTHTLYVKPSAEDPEYDELEFSPAEIDFLLQFINPHYLVPVTMSSMIDVFVDQCHLKLSHILAKNFADEMQRYINSVTTRRESDKEESPDFPDTWSEAVPPHKHRFLFIQAAEDKGTSKSPFRRLIEDLIPSDCFRKWLQHATATTIRSHNSLARRFRRGNDYTLAQRYDKEDPGLEICFSLTPPASSDNTNFKINENEQGSGQHKSSSQVSQEKASLSPDDPSSHPQPDPPVQTAATPKPELTATSDTVPNAVSTSVSETVAPPEPPTESETNTKSINAAKSENLSTAHLVTEPEGTPAPASKAEPERLQTQEPTTEAETAIESAPISKPEAIQTLDPKSESETIAKHLATSKPEARQTSYPTTESDTVIKPTPPSKSDSAVQSEPTAKPTHGENLDPIPEQGPSSAASAPKFAAVNVDADELPPESQGSSFESAKTDPEVEEPPQEHGGYLAYMAPDDEVDDEEEKSAAATAGDKLSSPRQLQSKKPKHDPAVYQSSSYADAGADTEAGASREQEDEDPILFHMAPVWNQLSIVLRDKGTMRFVKYLSRQAAQDRWDVLGEFEVDGFVGDELDDEDDEGLAESHLEEGREKAGTRTGAGLGVEEEETEVELSFGESDETDSDD